jgi:predicted phosphodiesterase
MAEPYKWLAFGCTHAPITDEKYWLWLLKQIDDYQPDFLIHLGDALEATGASRWEVKENQNPCVLHEFHVFEEQVKNLNTVAPKAKKVFIYGNHDSNLLHEERVPKGMRKMVQHYWSEIQDGVMKDWHFPCHTYAHDQFYRLGQITFQHGGNTGTAHTDNHLFTQAVEYGVPNGLHVSAHTHAPVAPKQARLGGSWLPYMVANVGTGMDWKQANYMERASKAQWGRALVRGTVGKYSVNKRESWFGTRHWTAELLVHSWASKNRI